MAKVLKIKETIEISDFCDYLTLEQIQLDIGNLIKDYGKDARVYVDSGPNNYSLMLEFTRDETKKERDKRLKEKKNESDRIKEEKETQELLALVKQNKDFVKRLLNKKDKK